MCDVVRGLAGSADLRVAHNGPLGVKSDTRWAIVCQRPEVICTPGKDLADSAGPIHRCRPGTADRGRQTGTADRGRISDGAGPGGDDRGAG